MSRKLMVQGILSLLVGAVCVVYAVHGMDGHAVLHAVGSLGWQAVALYLLTMVVTHLFRTLRWEYLLRALGTSLPFRRLLPISSVGFMAILALPVRLGEFVRPYLVARERKVRMSTMVGAVAVERIVDGLMISDPVLRRVPGLGGRPVHARAARGRLAVAVRFRGADGVPGAGADLDRPDDRAGFAPDVADLAGAGARSAGERKAAGADLAGSGPSPTGETSRSS